MQLRQSKDLLVVSTVVNKLRRTRRGNESFGNMVRKNNPINQIGAEKGPMACQFYCRPGEDLNLYDLLIMCRTS